MPGGSRGIRNAIWAITFYFGRTFAMLTIDLQGRVALVVGGSRGIGWTISETLAQAGAALVLTHNENPERTAMVDAACAEKQRQGQSVEGFFVDACDPESMASCVEGIVRRHGKIDILVYNVGKNTACPAESLDRAGWQVGIDVNLSAAYISVHAVLPHMLRAGYGRIVMTGSSAAYDGGGGAIDYAAAKAGLHGMMAYLARNYARKGISTNVIDPCVIETDLLRERYGDPEKRQQLVAQVPVGRLGTPADIAGLTAYLVSPWGDFICGQTILVDGGRTLFK
jgi:NAD(P)-dependent dehydrogenase (short-subunit alcohol dehydrogenase family)